MSDDTCLWATFTGPTVLGDWYGLDLHPGVRFAVPPRLRGRVLAQPHMFTADKPAPEAGSPAPAPVAKPRRRRRAQDPA